MNPGCPNLKCKYHQSNEVIKRNGTYFRANDSRYVQRFKCTSCRRHFSFATFSLAKGQKKRRVNVEVEKLLSASVSMRRIARILNIHELTVKRKLEYLAKKAKLSQEKLLLKLRQNPIHHMQFDDLITIEHTKLKPIAVTVAVDVRQRTILGAQVSRIPAFGHLAEISRRKYGYCKSNYEQNARALFRKIKDSVHPNALIETDEHQMYPKFVREFFPKTTHETFKSERGSVAGQGELKKVQYDPLFAINHTLAMMRANINRLVRRTWCTTKDPKMLQLHLDLFVNYYNQNLI